MKKVKKQGSVKFRSFLAFDPGPDAHEDSMTDSQQHL